MDKGIRGVCKEALNMDVHAVAICSHFVADIKTDLIAQNLDLLRFSLFKLEQVLRSSLSYLDFPC